MKLFSIKQSILIFTLFSSLYSNPSLCDEIVKNSVDNVNRNSENKKRDIYRNPKETLIFFGIKPDMDVLEILPGKGYYTEILGHLLSENGQLTVASFGEDHKDERLRSIHNMFQNYFIMNEKNFGKINIKKFNNQSVLNGLPENSFDMVLTFRNTHNWINFGVVDKVYKAINRVLKKGGTLGVVQHRSKDLQDPIVSAKNGYVPEEYLINLIEKSNFKFISKSEINSNPLDTKNYARGVWTLPPTLRLENKDKEKYLKIGESDRMTLKFHKK